MQKIIFISIFLVLSFALFAHEPPLTKEEYDEAIAGMQKSRLEKELTLDFVSGAGLLKENEHAVVPYIDATVLLPAFMLSYQYGLYYWITVGFDVGGNYDVFQVLITVKQEMLRTRSTDFFFLGWHIKTGFKQHQTSLIPSFEFDDLSWVIIFDNTFAFRLGRKHKEQRQVIYLTSEFYFDIDLRGEGRQVDIYIAPGILGFETFIGEYGNFFIEAGAMLSLNGMDAGTEILYEKQWFPVGKIGFALRTGDLTADINNNPRNLKKYDRK